MLYKMLPQYKTKNDIIKTLNEEHLDDYNIIIETNCGDMYAENIAEVAILIKENLTREEILSAINSGILHNRKFNINPKYKEELIKYLR